MERLHTYENFLTIEECESILNKLVDDDLIIESPLASGYYVVKN